MSGEGILKENTRENLAYNLGLLFAYVQIGTMEAHDAFIKASEIITPHLKEIKA